MVTSKGNCEALYIILICTAKCLSRVFIVTDYITVFTECFSGLRMVLHSIFNHTDSIFKMRNLRFGEIKWLSWSPVTGEWLKRSASLGPASLCCPWNVIVQFQSYIQGPRGWNSICLRTLPCEPLKLWRATRNARATALDCSLRHRLSRSSFDVTPPLGLWPTS